jgi:uncharacterized membrane protein
VVGKLSDFGIDDNCARQVATTLTPNSSANFVLDRRATVDKVVLEISKYGGTVLQTSLAPDLEAKLQAALLQGASASTPPADTGQAHP